MVCDFFLIIHFMKLNFNKDLYMKEIVACWVLLFVAAIWIS